MAVTRLHPDPRMWVGRELITGEALVRELHRGLQLAAPVLRGLPPQAEDEVDRHRVETGGQGRFDHGPRLPPIVTAAEETQSLVREGLHTERQRAHAEGPPRR